EPVNSAPTVSITHPTKGSSFSAGSSITVTAKAADADGAVKTVKFYNGNQLLGEDTTSPYSIEVSNAVAGEYKFKAVALDDQGASTTSSIVKVNVVEESKPEIVNVPPTVAIATPNDGTTIPAGDNFIVEAQAEDADGTVKVVKFYEGDKDRKSVV